MLDNVDIYAPFREDAEANAYRPKGKKERGNESICVGLCFQTSLGFAYEINIPCKPSENHPNLPDLHDFVVKIRAFSRTFDVEREAKKMFRSMDGKIPLERLRDVANEAYRIFTSIDPKQLFSLFRRGGGEVDF